LKGIVLNSTLFLPLTKSNNNFLSLSLALPELGKEYEELVKSNGSQGAPFHGKCAPVSVVHVELANMSKCCS
jgi:hypothetical protein